METRRRLSPLEERLAIIRYAAMLAGCHPRIVMFEERTRNPVAFTARAHAMAMIRIYHCAPFQEIGEIFGKDHSSVMNALAVFFGWDARKCRRSSKVGRGDAIERGFAAHGDLLLEEAEQAIESMRGRPEDLRLAFEAKTPARSFLQARFNYAKMRAEFDLPNPALRYREEADYAQAA